MEETLTQAVKRFIGQACRLAVEEVNLENSLGRWVAEEVRARFPWPPFHRSLRDGFALNHRAASSASPERPVRLPIAATVPAGSTCLHEIDLGSVVRIYTGALLPPGTNAVIPCEEVEVDGETVVISRPVQPGQYIRRKGTVVEAGEVVVSPGTRITPAEIELLATNGLASIKVYQRPLVSILPVGSELVEPGEELALGRIYASNGYTIAAWTQKWGGSPRRLACIPDDLELIIERVRSLLPVSDVIVTTGGTSKGDFDFAPRVLEELAATRVVRLLSKTAGGPFVGGFVGSCPVLCLSGSPKAAVRSAKLFLKPLLAKMQGADS